MTKRLIITIGKLGYIFTKSNMKNIFHWKCCQYFFIMGYLLSKSSYIGLRTCQTRVGLLDPLIVLRYSHWQLHDCDMQLIDYASRVSAYILSLYIKSY